MHKQTQMKNLYSVNARDGTFIAIDKTKDGAEITIKGPPSWTVVFDSVAGKSYKYVIKSGTRTGVVRQDFPYYSDYRYSDIIVTYTTTDDRKADLYARLFPFDLKSIIGARISENKGICCVAVVSQNAGTYVANCINTTSQDQYIIHNKKYYLPPDKVVQVHDVQDVAWVTIRSTEFPHDVTYRELTPDEQLLYIPKTVALGVTRNINISTSFVEWVPNTECLYHGTLTYIPTHDKDIHMQTEEGDKFRYGIEHLRYLLPYMYNGKVSGSFKYVGRGSRQIKYVLIPHDGAGTKSDLLVCDSESSDEES